VAGRFGRAVRAEEADRLLSFFGLLLTWNRRINLTGAQSLEELLEGHLPDSLALERLVPEGHSLLDVGSGGGLPAIPFGVLRPDVRLTLLEPRSRRAAFLRTALRDLGIPGGVEGRRLEQVSEQFEVLSARAVLPPDEWVKAAVPRVTRPGRIVVYLQEPTPWKPPEHLAVVDSLTYKAENRDRRAVALGVPRGTMDNAPGFGTR
jgi:16S rRNA (guanine527-N7)-methyltransferase